MRGQNHGRIDRIGRRSGKRHGTSRAKALLIAAACLLAVAVFLFAHYQRQAKVLKRQQAENRALYAAASVQPAQEAPSVPAASQPPASIQPSTAEVSVSATPVPTVSPRFSALLAQNRDTVGWLYYPGFSEIDFPVVQRDNLYYLDRDFKERPNLAGTVFLDDSNQILPRDKNLILHGHNMQNGTMFGKLARLFEPNVLINFPLLHFDTLYNQEVYVPYALTVFSANPKSDRYFDIVQPDFASPEAMGEYVNWLRARSVLPLQTDICAQDRLLTLVTCHGSDEDERLALALRAVRPGENMAGIEKRIFSGLK